MKSKTIKKVGEVVLGSGLSISDTALKIIVPSSISTKDLSKFEDAVFHSIQQIALKQVDPKDNRSILDNILSSRKVELRKILNIVEEITNPVYLHKGEALKSIGDRNSLFTDGLAPDIAWRLQSLLDSWHKNDPLLFPKISLRIYYMRLQFQNKDLNQLYSFFETVLDFERILSLRDLFSASERNELFPDEINVSIFKNHVEVYLKKDLDNLDKIIFSPPAVSSNNDFGILVSDISVLDTLCDIIKPKLFSVIDAILRKATDMGFDSTISSQIRENFVRNFSIKPQFSEADITYLQERGIDIFHKNFNPKNFKPEDIVMDFDVLHYIRALTDGYVSLEELFTTSTKLIHAGDVPEDRKFESEESYDLARMSGKPIIKTRYFLNNPGNFYIRTLDLSNVRLIKQPDMQIIAHLKHLKTLILSNNRSSGEYDISEIKFGNISQLENLYLKNCGLKAITSDMFKGNSSLRSIDVTSNPIHSIDQTAFDNVPIEELHLSSDLDNFPANIQDLINKTCKNKELRRRRIIESMG